MRAERAARRDADRHGAADGRSGRGQRQAGLRGRRRREGVRRPRRRPRLLHPRDPRRSHRPHRPQRRRQDHAAAAAARRAGARQPARCGTAPTCRSPTTTSSASSSTPSAPSSTPSATATTASPSAGRTRHVHGYLEDFLFPPERARSPVKALSGGERNRLLLARLFTRPANVLVLDEPTNDLDLETLELLEAQLVDWPGTLLVVSHDRRFLDHVVTSTHRLRGRRPLDGVRRRLRRLAAAACVSPPAAPAATAAVPSRRSAGRSRRSAAPGPAPQGHQQGAARVRGTAGAHRGARTGAARLSAAIAAPDFYKRPAAEITATMARLDAIPGELLAAYARWDELDGLR